MIETGRLFVAITLPDEVKTALAGLRGELDRGLTSVRWVREESIHLTLKFLGDVEVTRLEDIRGELMTVVPGEMSIPLEAAGVGVFPHHRAPRVLWVGFREVPEALAMLQQQVESEMERLGFPPERRAFNPHLTLGRFRRQLRWGERDLLGRTIDRDSGRGFGEFTAIRFSLYRSILGPGGARYEVLDGWPAAATENG